MAERLQKPINSERLRITLFSPYPMERHGGVQENVRNLAKNYNELGHTATIVAPYSQSHVIENGLVHLGLSHSFKIKGTSVETAIIPDSNTLAVLRQIPTDIMAHNEAEIYGVSHVAHWMSGVYHFDTFHSYNEPNWKYTPWQFVAKLYALRITGRILVSSVNLPFAQKYFPGEYEIIQNGVDTQRFNPKNTPIEKFMDGKKNILFVGRLEDRKGLNLLLDVLPITASEIPNIRLIVVGDGPNKHAYQQQAEAIVKATGAEICFEGAVSAEQLPSYYKTADVFSSPAPYGESQGIVNLEAQASGVPPVCGDNPGYRTSVKSGVDGILVNPKDTQNYSNWLKLVLTSESLRSTLIENGLKTAKEHDWQIIAKRTLEYYLRKIAQKQSIQKNI